MSESKFLKLCAKIAKETDPAKFPKLMRDLNTLLREEEQDRIKENIGSNRKNDRGNLPY